MRNGSPIFQSIQAGEGKLYLCAVKDCYSNKIVGYSIDSQTLASLVVAAGSNAITLRAPDGTILHADRGSQNRSKKVLRLLTNNGIKGSMGRVGAAGDNAAMESFFSLLQKNVLNTKRWETRGRTPLLGPGYLRVFEL
jgi:transposase InsO family protein